MAQSPLNDTTQPVDSEEEKIAYSAENHVNMTGFK